MIVAAATRAASKRHAHEAHVIDEHGGVFAVVTAHHARARRIVVDALHALGKAGVPDVAAVAAALDDAGRRLQASARREESLAASATALVVHGARAAIVHQGVTCGYRVRDGALRRLTGDHAYRAPGAPPMLMSWLGQPAAPPCEIADDALLPGDRFVIASDAVADRLDDRALIEVAMLAPDLAARTLVERALAAGHPEATAIVVVAPPRDRL